MWVKARPGVPEVEHGEHGDPAEKEGVQHEQTVKGTWQ